MYMDLIEYNKVVHTEAPLLHCFFFLSKLKVGDIITTGQYKNTQNFVFYSSELCSKNLFIVFTLTSGKKTPFVSVGITRRLLMFRKASNIHF